MRPFLLSATLLSAALLAATPAAAEERTMSWDAVEVEARLDARGDLHVRERQVIRLHGPWNGGERRFRIERGQRLRFERLLRETPAGPVEVPAGDLGTVDRHAFTGPTTLRWRCRAADAPPYAGEVLGYVLEYTLERVLVAADGGGALLSHDLVFPDRDWPIARARGRIVLEEAWQVAEGTLEAEQTELPPGAGLVVAARLRWAGAGAPPDLSPAAPEDAAEGDPLPPAVTAGLAAALAAILLAVALATFRHARRQGQLAPDPTVDEVDDRFLAEHLLAWPPEVIAAAWHGRVGVAAVAAVVARHCAARRIQARVEGKTLHLRLLVRKDAFEGSDAALIRALFPKKDDTIDTDRLRKHYRGSGFSPASLIQRETEERLRAVDGLPAPPPARWPRIASGALVVVTLFVGLFASYPMAPGEDELWHLLDVFAVPSLLVLLTMGLAHRLASAARRPRRPAAALALLLGLWGAFIVSRALEVGGDENVFTLAAHVLGWTAAALAVLGYGRTQRQPEAHLFRKRIAAARDWLARELGSSSPRLEDAWAPWLVALGLSRDADRWFAAHPRAASGGDVARGRATGSGSTAGTSSSAWTGGGGLFSGGGASGTWAALVGIARSYPRPPSSSGSGGSRSSSSSRSSSGGGGGGGW